jgi:hypothetical protein
MKEFLTDPTVLFVLLMVVFYMLSEFFKYMRERNPEQKAWDDLYNITGRIVKYVEQTFRPQYGSKLTKEGKTHLKEIAINEVMSELNPKIEKEIMRNKRSGNVFKKILGTVVEAQVLKLKRKL